MLITKKLSLFFNFQPSVEAMWAIKAYQHAEIYFNVSIGLIIFKLKAQGNVKVKIYEKVRPLDALFHKL